MKKIIKLYNDLELYADLNVNEFLKTTRRKQMERTRLKVTEAQAKRITNLVKKIRMTRNEWCELVNESLRYLNTYEDKTDAFIIIEALKHYLYDEEEEVESMYEALAENQPKKIPKEEKNDKAD